MRNGFVHPTCHFGGSKIAGQLAPGLSGLHYRPRARPQDSDQRDRGYGHHHGTDFRILADEDPADITKGFVEVFRERFDRERN